MLSVTFFEKLRDCLLVSYLGASAASLLGHTFMATISHNHHQILPNLAGNTTRDGGERAGATAYSYLGN